MKARKFFLLFAAMALAPLILAFVVLKAGWYNAGVTAKGTFLEHEMALPVQSSAGKWHIVAKASYPCLEVCQEISYSLIQIPVALGKERSKVEVHQLDLQEASQISDSSNSSNQTVLNDNHLYLVDPFGKAILKYEITTNREATIETCKDVLHDLKRLLKYSRTS